MKIILTGHEGYIGSVLSDVLLSRDHEVAGIDTGFYRIGEKPSASNSITNIYSDIRSIESDQLQGFDMVIHLADLSNDPLGMIDENVTKNINYYGVIEFAKKAKKAGVKRFIYSSSCSVYGVELDKLATEESETNPQTMYAKCKLAVERELALMASTTFSPVFLRNSTVYGVSPSMRFDLVINKLVGDAYVYNKITLDNKGALWRPVVHILDTCRAFVSAIEAPQSAVHNEIFNVGGMDSNYQIIEFANMIREEFPDCEVILGDINNDVRSYRVSFEKINAKLPGFQCNYDVRNGIKEIKSMCQKIGLTARMYEGGDYHRLRRMSHLLKSEQIDSLYHWKSAKNAEPYHFK